MDKQSIQEDPRLIIADWCKHNYPKEYALKTRHLLRKHNMGILPATEEIDMFKDVPKPAGYKTPQYIINAQKIAKQLSSPKQ